MTETQDIFILRGRGKNNPASVPAQTVYASLNNAADASSNTFHTTCVRHSAIEFGSIAPT